MNFTTIQLVFIPGKKSPTVTSIFPRATGLGMSLPVGLNSVSFGAPVALPLLLPMLSAEMLLDASEISQRPGGIMVHAGGFWAYVNSLPHLRARSLFQFPWQVMPSPVKLQVLISLEPFAADLTDESVGSHESPRRQSNHFCIWVCKKHQYKITRPMD